MKNLLNVFAIVLVALSVVACSSKKSDDSSMKNESTNSTMMKEEVKPSHVSMK